MKGALPRRWSALWERERPWLLFLLLFALVFLRFCYYGFTYFPQLDDYIQLHNQAAYYTFDQVILGMGLLSSRPLASVLDYGLWSHFWPCLILACALLAALYAASGCLFRRVWGEYFGTGPLFLVFYALLPLGMEGTYWISASNRVVSALFFTALAMWLFGRWCRLGRWPWLILYFFTQLLSFCFYEQGLILSVTGVLLVGILEWKERNRRSVWALLTFLNAGIYFAFTSAFATTAGQLGSRLKLSLPWHPGWSRTALEAGGRLWRAFAGGGYRTLARGFRRGLGCFWEELHPLWLLALAALLVLLFLFARRFPGKGERPAAALIVGFLMALAPVTLFFVLADPSVALRNTVFSFCGLGLMLDALFQLLLRRTASPGAVCGGVCVLLAAVFSIAAVSELHDYRDTYRADQRAAAAICAALEEMEPLPAGASVGVVGLQADYLPEQNYRYATHIHGATESTWALTGLLTAVSDDPGFPWCTPLPTGEEDLTPYEILLFYDHVSGVARPYRPAPAEQQKR